MTIIAIIFHYIMVRNRRKSIINNYKIPLLFPLFAIMSLLYVLCFSLYITGTISYISSYGYYIQFFSQALLHAGWTACNGNNAGLTSIAVTVSRASLSCGMPWTFITDTSHRLGDRVQIPGTPSPCHLPREVTAPLPGFFAGMIP